MSEPRTFLNGRVILHAGDCREILLGMADNSVDSVVTDPPYCLTSIQKRFGKNGSAACKHGKDGSFARLSGGFMNSKWDDDVAFHTELWVEVLRVLKPGGYIMAFSGCRTYHRMACAIEDAGFITHPMFYWAFGSGFPKAHSVSKQIDKEQRREYVQAAIKLGLNIPGNSLHDWTKAEHSPSDKWWEKFKAFLSHEQWMQIERGVVGHIERGPGWFTAQNGHDITAPATDAAREWDGWFYGTQSLKPSVEPVYFGQKPFEKGLNGAQNVQKWGTGAINVGACKIPSGDKSKFPAGVVSDTESVFGNGVGLYSNSPRPADCDPTARWPANLIHDNSEEVLACFPETIQSGNVKPHANNGHGEVNFTHVENSTSTHNADSGSAARFFASFPEEGEREYVRNNVECNEGYKRPEHSMFTDKPKDRSGPDNGGSPARYFASFPQDVKRIWYGSKADADDRLGSKHPTVKPLALIQYLVRLVTPKNGTCLDLFAGTGTLGESAFREGFRSILIEREAEYIADIERRMSLVMEGQDTRAYASMKARNRPRDDGPLFGGSGDVGIDRRSLNAIDGSLDKDRHVRKHVAGGYDEVAK
jgi:DNA modification methylase